MDVLSRQTTLGPPRPSRFFPHSAKKSHARKRPWLRVGAILEVSKDSVKLENTDEKNSEEKEGAEVFFFFFFFRTLICLALLGAIQNSENPKSKTAVG